MRRVGHVMEQVVTRENIDHCLMLAALARLFKDPVLLRTFENLLNSFRGPVRQGAGIPVGNLTNQHFANHFLGVLDHFVKEVFHAPGYVRYMDDFVLWARHKAELVAGLREVRGFVRDRLNLAVKDDVLLNRSDRGLPFLGYRVFPERVLLAKRSRKRFRRKLLLCERRRKNGEWNEEVAAQHAEPLVAFTRFADAGGFRQNTILWTAERLRAAGADSADGGVVDKDRAASEGSNRVKRGGSWNNNASNCRVSNRNNNTPGNSNNNIGFRPVLPAAQQPCADAGDCWTGHGPDWTGAEARPAKRQTPNRGW